MTEHEPLKHALAAIIGSYEQHVIETPSSSPEYKSWEKHSVATILNVLGHDELMALAAVVAEHFQGTNSPLGQQARAALAKAKPETTKPAT